MGERQGSDWLAQTLGRLLENVRALVHADGAAFLRLDRERGYVEAVASWFSSPELRAAIELAHERPYDRGRPGLVEVTLERNRSLLLPRVDAWQAAPELHSTVLAALGPDRGAQVWDVFGGSSVIACPVKTVIGRPVGILVVACVEHARPLGAQELKTVEVLADLSAHALERAELLQAEGRRAREELLLNRASEAMAASLEPDEVYRRIVRHAALVTGARKAMLTRLDARASELRVTATVGFSEVFSEQSLRLSGSMLGEVVRERRPYLSDAAHADRWDRSVVEPEEIASFMHAPIELGPRLFGVLTVADSDPEAFGQADLDVLVRLARSSAAAIANAIDFQHERHVARALTAGFVPESLPELPGYEVGLLYQPASGEATGGDIYGAWELPGGEVALLIGDVAGKGVETAALSAMVRFFVEARSWDSARPCEILAQTHAMLMGRLPRDTFVTAFLGILSPGRMSYCNAGHLPPLLVSADGGVSSLTVHGLPLGIEADWEHGQGELELRPDDLVFACTDGLIEARHAGEIYGEERLIEFLTANSASLPPAELVHAANADVGAFADGLSDDAVALALRRRAG